MAMEDLLPSLSSDDEDNHISLEQGVDNDSDGEEINVEFGGILVRGLPNIEKIYLLCFC
jgi:hypothetical protein